MRFLRVVSYLLEDLEIAIFISLTIVTSGWEATATLGILILCQRVLSMTQKVPRATWQDHISLMLKTLKYSRSSSDKTVFIVYSVISNF